MSQDEPRDYCLNCGAYRDKRMGCTGCLALFGAVGLTIGFLAVATMFFEPMAQETAGFVVVLGLVYAGLAALSFCARWYRRM